MDNAMVKIGVHISDMAKTMATVGELTVELMAELHRLEQFDAGIADGCWDGNHRACRSSDQLCNCPCHGYKEPA